MHHFKKLVEIKK